MRRGLEAAAAKMRESGDPDAAIRAFGRLYELLTGGDSGVLRSADLEPATDVPILDDLPAAGGDGAASALDRTVVIKLNGGLGTSMGLASPKSLIQARDGMTFLDVIAAQVLALRRRTGARLPLVLMNSFSTREASLAALERHPGLAADVPPDFLQHREPRLRAGDLMPLDVPDDRRAEWCPPGHGDVYTALGASGMLAELRGRGYEYAFLSNADNLGAVLDLRILAWVAAERIPFLMEVVEGTAADRKGGHIARRSGRLLLRETAQAPGDEVASFRDFQRWRFYNSNNIWVSLAALDELLQVHAGVLPLPLIVNRKSVTPPHEDAAIDVLQLETAMGSALGLIDGARVLRVPRSRFAPVKSTEDLLVVRSDVYELTDDAHVVPSGGVAETPLIELDPRFYVKLDDFDARFPEGAPSLRRCERLTIEGDVTFGRGVAVAGSVTLAGPARIPDGAILGESRAA